MGSEPEHVDTERARQLVAGGEVTAIDIRDPDDFGEHHIPGARPAAGDDADSLAEDLEEEANVLVVGEDGERGAKFAAELRERGVEAASIEGGTKGWTSDQMPTQPTVDPEQEPAGPPKLLGSGTSA